MKTQLFATAMLSIAALSSVNSFAMSRLEGEAAQVVQPADFMSTLTRSQVQSEYLQARRSGALPRHAESNSVSAPSSTTSLTREQVRMQAAMSVSKDGSYGSN